MSGIARLAAVICAPLLAAAVAAEPVPKAQSFTIGESVIVAMIGGLVSLVIALGGAWLSVRVARRTAEAAYEHDRKRRQSELSLKVSQIISEDIKSSRRFAVAVIKIISGPNSEGLTYFIPVNSRITVGRDKDNDIVLMDTFVSRFHCGFVSDHTDVLLEDYNSTNKAEVNGFPIDQPRPLEDGDLIDVADYRFRFRFVHHNKALVG